MTSKDCDVSNPDLYNFSSMLVMIMGMCTLMVLVGFLAFWISIDLLVFMGFVPKSQADQMSNFQTVAYDAAVFGKGEDAQECACCAEVFNARKVIKATPCGHHFHEKCLGRWMTVASTCPLCRFELSSTSTAVSETVSSLWD